MYRLDFTETACRVFDDRDRLVFTGSPRECENWLDRVENQGSEISQAAFSTNDPSLSARLRSWLTEHSSRPSGASCEVSDGRS